MLSFLKSRAFLTVLGLLLLAFCIIYFGPYIAFGSEGSQWVPLGTLTGQLTGIGVVVAFWGVIVLIGRLRANRASDQLMAAVAEPPKGGKAASPEMQQLRQRFEEAVATLKQKRRSGHSLYDLPWYAIIGAPGSGKTTALVNSGLNFPLEQRTGKGALRGVGGTRNCDWWFTDEAVLLDTAGRYTTQDSDAAADSAGWAEFLALLRKYRKRRPLNGVILTISVPDLLAQGPDGLEAHVLAVRTRLNELNKELRVQLPVYVLVTKCDLMAGFTEYFDDLSQDGRAQVWGVTFPYEQTVKGTAADAYPAEFDALVERLNDRLLGRIEAESDIRRRARVFSFPQQVAAVKDALTTFVTEVFGGTRFDRRVLLRGVYFTSGTQVGNPIDRLLGAIGRRFAIAPDVVAPPSGKGRAYFIQRLLKDVLFAESGLAGVDRRAEALKATTQLGAYLAMALAVVLFVTLWSVSYSRNQAYLSRVLEEVEKVKSVAPATADASLEDVVLRLDAVSDVMEAAKQAPSRWAMGWGLYQVPSMVAAATAAYSREAGVSLLPRIADLFHRRLMNTAGRAEELYIWLKAYLMLTEPEHLNKGELGSLTDFAWDADYAANPELRDKLSQHFHRLLDGSEGLPEVRRDDGLVRSARSALAQVSLPTLTYQFLRSQDYSAEDLSLQLIGADKVLRASRLSGPVPGVFTKKGFVKITSKDAGTWVQDLRKDDWVWGEFRPPAMPAQELKAKVLEQYETDYIKYWQGFIDDLKVVTPNGLSQTAEAMQILCGQTSPLRAALKAADDQTFLTKPPDAAAAGNAPKSNLTDFLRSRSAATASAAEVGSRTTEYFGFLHRLVNGSPSQLDGALIKLCEVQKKVQAIGPSVGGTDAGSSQTIRALSDDVRSLEQDAAQLPPSVAAVVTGIANSGLSAVRGTASSDREKKYQQEVVAQCNEFIADRYPFSPTATRDVQLKDFTDLFKDGGIYDGFFKRELADLVDVNQRPWKSRPNGVQLPSSMLRRFEEARRINETFLVDGAKLGMPIIVTPADLSGARGVVIELEKKKLEYRNGPTPDWEVTWPSQGPDGITITITATSGARTTLPFSGPWAWFKVINAGKRLSGAQEQMLIQLGNDTASVDLNLTARSVRNPMAALPLLQQFQCR